MSERFTPGPWKTWNDVHGVEDDRPGLVIMPDGADCGGGRKYCIAGGGNVVADARLIAAAPEMYALLDDLYHEYGDEFIARAIWAALRARINGEGE